MPLQSLELIQKQLPTRKDEDWKYADLSFLQKQNFVPYIFDKDNECEYKADEKKLILRIYNSSALAKIKTLSDLPRGFQFLNGKDLKTSPLSTFSSYDNYFLKLGRILQNNQLFAVVTKDFPSDVLIEVEMGGSLPISTESRIHNTQLSFIFEESSSVSILERSLLQPHYFNMTAVDYFLKANAQVKILKVETGAAQGRAGHTSRLSVMENAEARITTLTHSSEWSRHNIFTELDGASASVNLEAAYLTHETQFIDHHTVIAHRVPNTLSSQKYNGVLADKSKGVFNGKVIIARDAQKSAAVQLNRNLLMSKQAEINTKPELQIDADDVQAKHGATVGQLNPEQLFYLLSRGISEPVARHMLTRGFIEEVGLNLPEVLQRVFFKEVAADVI